MAQLTSRIASRINDIQRRVRQRMTSAAESLSSRNQARRALREELLLAPAFRFRRLEARRVLNADFAFDGVDQLVLDNFDGLGGTSSVNVSQVGDELRFDLDGGSWLGVDSLSVFVDGIDSSILHVKSAAFLDALDTLDLQILDSNNIGLGVSVVTDVDLPDSPLNGTFLVDVDGSVAINSALDTLGNSLTVTAGGSISSNALGSITTFDDTIDEDSGNLSLTAGTNVTLLGSIDTSGFDNGVSALDSDGGAVTIVTVNGDITTVAIDSRGGTTTDATIMGEGGTITLDANDGDASGTDGDVTVGGALNTSTEIGALKVDIDADRDANINAAITTLGGHVDVDAGRDITSTAAGDITTTGDKPDEDSGNVTLDAGRNVTLAGHVHTTGFNNGTSAADSAAGLISITTVNGNITTLADATLNAVGGDNDDADALPNGEGGTITLTANDAVALEVGVGTITLGAAVATSTELAKPIRVDLNAEEDINVNASITTLGASVDIDAGGNVTSTAAGTMTTTGDKIDEDSGDVTIDTLTSVLAGSVSLSGAIDTSGFDNATSALDSDGGVVTIVTVNGDITTSAIDSRGGTTTDATIMGEGGTITLDANDGDASGADGDVTVGGALQTSTEVAALNVDIDADRDANINAAITTLGGHVDVDAGRDITSTAAGDITTTGDKLDEDSGNVTLDAGRNVALLGDIDTSGLDNATSALDSDGGVVTIVTVNGDITTAAIDSRGGTTTDATIMGEGGTITLDANDGDASGTDGDVTVGGALNTSTEIGALKVDIDADRDANINAAITTLGGHVDVDAGRDITSTAAGDITTTGDKPDEDSGNVTLDAGRNVTLAGHVHTTGFNNGASAADSAAGLISITTVNGNITTLADATLNAVGGDNDDADALPNGEGGTITLTANDAGALEVGVGTITLGAAVATSTELAKPIRVDLNAEEDINVNASITTLGASVDIDAGGNVTSTAAGTMTTTGDKIDEDSGDVTIDTLTSVLAGSVSLSGAIDTSGFDNATSALDSDGGVVTIVTVNGDITTSAIDSRGGTTTDATIMGEGGTITLDANDGDASGTDGDVTVAGTLQTSTEVAALNVDIDADRDANINAAITTLGGHVDVDAGRDITSTAAGDITTTGDKLDEDSGNVTLDAGRNVALLGDIDTSGLDNATSALDSDGGVVTIVTVNGDITTAAIDSRGGTTTDATIMGEGGTITLDANDGDASGTDGDVTVGGALNTSTEIGALKVDIDADRDANINAAITTLGGHVDVDAGRDITSTAAGDITTTGDKPDEDSGNVTLDAGRNVTLAGHVHTTGFNNGTSAADSAAGLISITTVNGNITTLADATLNAVGGDNDDADALPNGEGGTITLTANDAVALEVGVGTITLGAAVATSTELAKPIRVDLNAEEDINVNASITTLGASVDIDAGGNVTSTAAGTMTTTGDKIDEDSGDVTIDTLTSVLAGSVSLSGAIDTSGFDNATSALDSDGGVVTIVTVNGDITTSAIDSRGGTTTDATIMGEGGTITLDANDGDASGADGDVTVAGTLQTSTEVAALNVDIDADRDANINAAITTLGGHVDVDAGRDITSTAAGDITTTGDKLDEDSGNVTLDAGRNVALLGDIDTSGLDNATSALDSDGGVVTIVTVNGDITTAAIDSRGGTTTDATIMGEGGTITLDANDGDASGTDGDVTVGGALNTSTEIGALKVDIDADREANINAAITTLGGHVDVDAGRDITSTAAGDITTTGDKPDEDSGNVTLDAGRNVTLAGHVHTTGFNNGTSAADSAAGLISITTVNGNITTLADATLNAVGGDNDDADALPNGEGGTITLTANDAGALEVGVGTITLGAAVATSTELAKPIRVDLNAEEDITVNASITTLGASVDIDAGGNVTSTAAGTMTTTGDKIDEDSGDVTIDTLTSVLAGSVSLSGAIDTSGFDNATSALDSDGGVVTIVTVNGDITTSAIDSRGGTTTDATIMGEGGTITLDANDGDASGADGDVTVAGTLQTSTEVAALNVDIDADRDANINAAITTLGGHVDVDAGRDITSTAAGDITTTGDKLDEDSGNVTLDAGRNVALLGDIDTSGLDNATSALDSDGGVVTIVTVNGDITTAAIDSRGGTTTDATIMGEGGTITLDANDGDASGTDGDVTVGGALNTSTEIGALKVDIDADRDANINAAITTLGGHVDVDAGRDITSTAAGDITTTGDKPDEDSGNVTLDAGRNVTLAGHVHTTGFNNGASAADSAAGLISITTVNGNITTLADATLNAVGGDNDDADALPNGEGGTITLTANDAGALEVGVGTITLGAAVATSTELAKPIRVDLNAEEDINVNASITTLGASVDIDAGGNVTSTAAGTMTTTGDKIDEDSGDVTIDTLTSVLAGSVSLSGAIDTSGFDNATSALDSDGGVVTIVTVNGDITTSAIDSRGGTTTDATIMGEGGTITLDANDGDASGTDGDVTVGGALNTSTEIGALKVDIDADRDANINAAITTLGGHVDVDAGRDITSTAAGDITTTGDKPDEDSGNVTLDAGRNVTLAGHVHTTGFNNGASAADSAAGLISITTVNGNITTLADATLNAVGGDNDDADALPNGEGGTITLTANDAGALEVGVGTITLGAAVATSTELAKPIRVDLNAEEDINVNASITTLGASVDIDAGGNVTSTAAGTMTTTGDKIDEDSGDVTIDTLTSVLAGSVSLSGAIDTSGFDNATSALDSDGGVVTIVTVNGDITTAAIDSRGGTTTDATIMGEGGTITLDANDGDASGTDGDVTVAGTLQTSTEVAALKVDIDADRDANINAAITTLGGHVDVDAGRDITSTAAGDITTTGDKPDEDSGHVTFFAAQDATLAGDITTTGFNNAASAADSLGGNIAVWVSRDITLSASALNAVGGDNDDADGLPNADGGHITLHADDDIALDTGASVTTNAVTAAAGTIYLLATNSNADASAGVVMEAGTSLVSGGGNIRMAADNEGDILLAFANAGSGNVSLLAERSILDNNGVAINVSADRLRMWADAVINADGTQDTVTDGNFVGTIGEPDAGNGTPALNIRAIDTIVTTLAAESATGIYVSESDSVSIDRTDDIAVQQVNLDLTLTDRTDESLSDLTTTAGGPIKLVSLAGSITVNDGDDADGLGVDADGTGDVLLRAAVDLIVNSDVQSDTGHITLSAGDDVDLNADVRTAGAGTIYILATNATADAISGVDMASGTSAITGGGNVRIVADDEGSILLSSIAAGTGDVSLVAEGSILDNNAGATNVAADTLRMWADAVVNPDGTQDTVTAGNGTGSIGAADAGNGTPALNIRAIDTVVTTLAARSATGIYISEFDSVVIDATGSIAVEQVRFNSTRSTVTDTSLSDLTTTSDGPIKLVSLTGSITVNDGDADGLGVDADGSGDVLLEARGAGSDIATMAEVASDTGHVTLLASDSITIGDDVRTGGTGTVLVEALAGSVVVSAGGVETVGGDLLLRAKTFVRFDASLRSSLGSIGVRAIDGDVLQNADISTGGDALVLAGNDIMMASGTTTTAGLNVLYRAAGTITLGHLTATHVAVEAGVSILDGNAGAVNVTSTDLSMRATAGMIGGPADAIETTIDKVAALSANGIYIRETSGSIVDAVAAVAVDVDVKQVQFNSTTSDVSIAAVIAKLDDLKTTADKDIELVDVGGSIALRHGTDGNEYAVNAGTGNVRLVAAGFVLAETTTAAASYPARAAIVKGKELDVTAGSYVHLPNTEVSKLKAAISAADNTILGNLYENTAANAKGQEVLGELKHPSGTVPTTPIASDSFSSLKDQFAFQNRFKDGYSLFVRNAGVLEVSDVTATGKEPGVYIETSVGDLSVKDVTLKSTTSEDGGVVLIAGGELKITGALVTEIMADATQKQVVNNVDLNADAFDGGKMVAPVSTKVVLEDTLTNRTSGEKLDTHVDQRVSMKFGSAGEEGFLNVVHYADGKYQVFDTQGQVALTEANNFTLKDPTVDNSAMEAANATAKLFARSKTDPFTATFLKENSVLPTDVVMRRSLDFFLFSTEGGELVDKAAAFDEVKDVISLGGKLGFVMIVEPAPMKLPMPAPMATYVIVEPPPLQPQVTVELPAPTPQRVDVAIYQVQYTDTNRNGQVELNELPSYSQVLETEIAADAQRNRVPIDPETGETPTQEDIEREKARLLAKPDQPTGAYAIIREAADGARAVLDVFGVRDWPEAPQEDAESPSDANIDVPKLEPFRADDLQRSDVQDVPPPPAEATGPGADDSSQFVPREQTEHASGSRLGSAGLLLGSLWMIRGGNEAPGRATAESDQRPAKYQDYSRRGRRRRMLES